MKTFQCVEKLNTKIKQYESKSTLFAALLPRPNLLAGFPSGIL